MAGARVQYIESREYYTVNYVRYSRAIGVLWGVFAVCYAIISVAVFVQPQWVGDTADSPGSGYFGLWRHCAHTASLQGDPALTCAGRLSDLSTNISPAFRAATVFVGLAVVVALLTIICFIMFCFLHANTVFRLCAWMQLLSGVCLLLAVLVFPAGWDAPLLREVCGPTADKYRPGGCGVRWALVLAAIGALDALVLAALALALANRRVLPPPQPEPAASLPWEAASLAGSRRSLNLQPVMLMPPAVREADRCSEYSAALGALGPAARAGAVRARP
ncbi:LHFPL tetraspan subfamily member 3 protein-like [Pollicipes pollicipes]|uniref:LHFPL tetraspan subfamily member 3 protein-like n=1 Tax=Pollicipes pollicipes TaxID=41117 RepID=UPI001884C5BF|nr:LHFPL tetraspan subfamily member 3 protein-like [Pollicipes pollicipes]